MPLLIAETTSARMDGYYREDPVVVTWWGTKIECVSALARLERDGDMATDQARLAFKRLDAASATWIEVPAQDDVRDQSIRLLRMHRLRAADATQIGAALVASGFSPRSLTFVTLDVRQGDAAEREGFSLLNNA
ncbi:MAG: type II toxin-antitoxin system VapC family toxin [Polaromonas sp.]|nr:type II toxin-antitoxin system VapC family toxin [Gemmatimonadaceae bacterium]